LNSVLLHLWGEEQSKRWAQKYQLFAETEQAQNGISMNHQIHHWFDNARFALKPLRCPDDNSIVVQWHWLKTATLKPWDRAPCHEPTASILERAGLTDKNWGERLAHRESGIPIRTGQIFTIRAENPEDLPSWDLLELSWNLLRVAAICGAADVDDAYWNAPHNDDEYVASQQAAREDRTASQPAAGQGSAIIAAGQGSAPPAKGKAKEEITGQGTGEEVGKEADEGAGKGEEEGRALRDDDNDGEADDRDDQSGSAPRRG